jgi:predicted RNase H-like nuclease (RuvC/YqgF family)
LCNEIVTLKDKNENLLKDINNLTSKIKSSITLEEENTRLKETIKDLTKTLANFVNGKENLDMLLGRQRCVFNKEGLGYTPENKQKFYKISLLKNSAPILHSLRASLVEEMDILQMFVP